VGHTFTAASLESMPGRQQEKYKTAVNLKTAGAYHTFSFTSLNETSMQHQSLFQAKAKTNMTTRTATSTYNQATHQSL